MAELVPMDIKLKVVSKPDAVKKRRDGTTAISFVQPAKGDCNVNCPACGFELEKNVAAEYVQSIHTFTCPACGAVSSPSTSKLR